MAQRQVPSSRLEGAEIAERNHLAPGAGLVGVVQEQHARVGRVGRVHDDGIPVGKERQTVLAEAGRVDRQRRRVDGKELIDRRLLSVGEARGQGKAHGRARAARANEREGNRHDQHVVVERGGIRFRRAGPC